LFSQTQRNSYVCDTTVLLAPFSRGAVLYTIVAQDVDQGKPASAWSFEHIVPRAACGVVAGGKRNRHCTRCGSCRTRQTAGLEQCSSPSTPLGTPLGTTKHFVSTCFVALRGARRYRPHSSGQPGLVANQCLACWVLQTCYGYPGVSAIVFGGCSISGSYMTLTSKTDSSTPQQSHAQCTRDCCARLHGVGNVYLRCRSCPISIKNTVALLAGLTCVVGSQQITSCPTTLDSGVQDFVFYTGASGFYDNCNCNPGERLRGATLTGSVVS